MAFDAHKNLAIATVVTPPAPATSGTSLTVGSGHGARLPAVPFNATVWAFDLLPDPATAEVVRVTARTADTLTIVRAQEGTTARAIVAGDLFAATITVKSLTDIESGVNFPRLATTAPGGVFLDSASGGPGASLIHFSNAGGNSYLGAESNGGSSFSLPPNVSTWWTDSSAGLALATGSSSPIRFYPAGITARGTMHPSGGFSWGSTTDPGAGIFTAAMVHGGPYIVNTYPGKLSGYANPSLGETPLALRLSGDLNGAGYVIFYNAAGTFAGNITQVNASTVAYNTTSDARLKTDRGRHTDPDVLRRTVIHDFVWQDGTPGRGVFAQEARLVAPFAVSVGTDERDEDGRLSKPWGVDYSKYVPDLIAGWQHHEVGIEVLAARLTAVEAATIGTSTPQPPSVFTARPSFLQRIRAAMAVLFPAWITP